MIKIAFLGDISFNDKYVELKKKGVNPFTKIIPFLKEQDLVIGNLECLAQGSMGENELKKPRIKTSLDALNYLKELNVSLVTLAHNHIYDNLTDGYRKTTGFLNTNNIESIGAGLSQQVAQKPYYFSKDGLKFCFLSYLTSDTNPNLPSDCPIFLNMYDQERIVKEIEENKIRCNYVILLLHWGGRFEGGKYPDQYQPIAARKFIKAGADLIIGHHSHTLQPFENISGKYVFYSLGNFCFSDIAFEGKVRNMSKKKYTESLIPMFQFEKGKQNLSLLPIRNKQLFVKKEIFVLLKIKLRNFLFLFLRINPFWFCYYISFKYIRPIIEQFGRKDSKKSILKRIFTLNSKKIKQLLGIREK